MRDGYVRIACSQHISDGTNKWTLVRIKIKRYRRLICGIRDAYIYQPMEITRGQWSRGRLINNPHYVSSRRSDISSIYFAFTRRACELVASRNNKHRTWSYYATYNRWGINSVRYTRTNRFYVRSKNIFERLERIRFYGCTALYSLTFITKTWRIRLGLWLVENVFTGSGWFRGGKNREKYR